MKSQCSLSLPLPLRRRVSSIFSHRYLCSGSRKTHDLDRLSVDITWNRIVFASTVSSRAVVPGRSQLGLPVYSSAHRGINDVGLCFRLSGCADSISSPALSFDSRLLRFLVVRGSALVGMVDGPLIGTASLLGLVGVGSVVWVCSPGC